MGDKKIQLLILTQSAPTRKSLNHALANDFLLHFLESSDHALSQFRKKLPDAVIMDQSMGENETYAFIDKVRNKPATRNLPFVIISRESSNHSIERAVRSGVSHFIGVPFEAEILVEKIYYAMTSKGSSHSQTYFKLPEKIETQVVAFGRISYITKDGIHFESHLKPSPESILQISSVLADALQQPNLEVKISALGTDTYYNYPFAVDAEWTDLKVKEKIAGWISANRHLNSPKKVKVLLVHSSLEFQENFANQVDRSSYSVRSVTDLQLALESLPFMRPACLMIQDSDWKAALPAIKQKLITTMISQKMRWILFGDQLFTEKLAIMPLQSPAPIESLVLAVRNLVPPLQPDPDRLYFSKTLEDSRLKIYFSGKTIDLGELGCRLALSQEIVPPCNFQLSLKVFSEENLRNPYVRAWPPLIKLSTSDSDGGKLKCAVDTHYLGINDQQGQGIRKFLRLEELKGHSKGLETIAPVMGSAQPKVAAKNTSAAKSSPQLGKKPQ